MKRVGYIISIVCISYRCMAQDIHFTQFNFSPLNENPANTGFFAGDIRAVGNYKNQWQSVPVAYNTGSLSVDGNLLPHHRHGIGVGMVVYYDRAGDSRFGSLNMAALVSYRIYMDKQKQHALSAGIQLGFVSRSFDYTQLFFDNQFTGDAFDPTKSTGENFAHTNFLFLDAGVGLSYRWMKDSRHQFTLSGAVAHINSPNQSFSSTHAVTLDPRYNVHLRAQVRIAKQFDLVPEFLFQLQGPKYEAVPGAHLKTYIGSQKHNILALNIGLYYRVGDAFAVLAGVDYDNWQLNCSYDINHTGFTPASRYNGGFELSIIYIYASVQKIVGLRPGCPMF